MKNKLLVIYIFSSMFTLGGLLFYCINFYVSKVGVSNELNQLKTLNYQSAIAYSYDNRIAGTTFDYNLLNDFMTNSKKNNIVSKPWSIVVFFNDVDCNDCLGESVYFLKYLKKDFYEKVSVLGICYSKDLNYVSRMKKLNKIKFEILFDRKKHLFNQLAIDEGPVLIVVDNLSNKIIYAFRPMPYTKNLTEDFFNKIKRLFSID